MPRPIIGAARMESVGSSRAHCGHLRTAGLREPYLNKRLREKRSHSYIDAVRKIDAGSYQTNRVAFDSLLQSISNEFPELSIEQMPLGIVSKCYLGSPFQAHICDFRGEILEHFEEYRAMAPLFERARSLAIHPDYEFIEVFGDTLRAVTTDGSVSVIGG